LAPSLPVIRLPKTSPLRQTIQNSGDSWEGRPRQDLLCQAIRANQLEKGGGGRKPFPQNKGAIVTAKLFKKLGRGSTKGGSGRSGGEGHGATKDHHMKGDNKVDSKKSESRGHAKGPYRNETVGERHVRRGGAYYRPNRGK